MENRKESTIDLRMLWKVIVEHWLLIVLATVACAILANLYASFMVTPTYSSRITFYVTFGKSTTQGTTDRDITSAQISTAQQLVATYIEILKSERVLNAVIEKSGINCSAGQIVGMISAASQSETEVFYVKVTNSDPGLAYDVAQAIGKYAPDEIVDVVGGGTANLLDGAKLDKSPDSPNIQRYTLVGAIAGFVVTYALFFLLSFLDRTVYTELELKDRFNIPTIGSIPEWANVQDN